MKLLHLAPLAQAFTQAHSSVHRGILLRCGVRYDCSSFCEVKP